MRNAVMRIVALSLTIGFTAGELRAQTALAWKFKKGDVLRYKIYRKAVSKVQPLPGSTAEWDPARSIEVTLNWTVTKVGGDGTAEITQRVERVRMEANERSGELPRLVYDSADRTTVNNFWSAVMELAYAPVIGVAYCLKIDRRGDLTEVQLPKGVLKGWEEIRGSPESGQDFLFTEAGLKSLLAIMPRLPSTLIDRGGTWESRRVKSELVTEATLVEVFAPTGPEGSATYEATPKISFRVLPGPVPHIDLPKQAVKVTFPTRVTIKSQSGKSQLTFDEDAGRLVKFSRQHTYEIKSTFGSSIESGVKEAKERVSTSTRTVESSVNLIPRR